ncbi:hypothetical protein AURDEDRAFT_45927, partial [Auricularia subglabra TFB-10046 SS5]
GYFPCAPKRPSMAFSFRLLELISLHSLHVAPNTTAWAATLENFWDRRGFTIPEKRAFRRRLGNALQWYQVMLNQKDHIVSLAVTGPVRAEDALPDGGPARAEDVPSDGGPADAPPVGGPARAEDAPPDEGTARRQRPSEYLRKRCHICFGGKRP